MMNDEKLKQQLQASLETRQGGDAPGFDEVWANAEQQHRAVKMRYRRFAGFTAAAAVAVTVFMIWPLNGNNTTGIYLTEEDLLNSTHWIAPSDVLLPKHQFDIYGDLPVLIDTEDFNEGSLL